MRIRALLLVGAVAAVTVGCGSGEAATSDGPPATTAAPAAAGPDLSKVDFVDLSGDSAVGVDARDNNFVKQYIVIKAGTKVTFTNRGRNEHDVEPVTPGAFKDIKTAAFPPQGGSASVTFAKPGDYPYYCTLHGTKTKGMVGAIRVLA